MDRSPGPLLGVDSYTWRTATQWTSLLGGPRALLLQLAHPKIAAAVTDHSEHERDPFGRLGRTLDAVMFVGFGSAEQRAATRARLDAVHGGVSGRTEAGDPYSAMDPELQLWVHASLIDTVLTVERRYLGRLDERGRARLYEESCFMAEAWGIPPALVPADLLAFRAYIEQSVASLRPSCQSRGAAQTVLRPDLGPLPPELLAPLEWITVELTPRPLRFRFGLGDLGPGQLAAVRAGQLWARNTLRWLPPWLARPPGTWRFVRQA